LRWITLTFHSARRIVDVEPVRYSIPHTNKMNGRCFSNRRREMKAGRIHQLGSPAVIVIDEIPRPVPKILLTMRSFQ
jgi:hypothetical protein